MADVANSQFNQKTKTKCKFFIALPTSNLIIGRLYIKFIFFFRQKLTHFSIFITGKNDEFIFK
jgi:hypothetical protein